jgi:hypothetical protein
VKLHSPGCSVFDTSDGAALVAGVHNAGWRELSRVVPILGNDFHSSSTVLGDYLRNAIFTGGSFCKYNILGSLRLLRGASGSSRPTACSMAIRAVPSSSTIRAGPC